MNKQPSESGSISDLQWIEEDKNPWGVPILDMRPYSTTVLATTTEKRLAENVISYFKDDGYGFIEVTPILSRAVHCQLRYPIYNLLAEGMLFLPQTMEHKWAIYYRGGHIIVVRSWERLVALTGKVEFEENFAVVSNITGAYVRWIIGNVRMNVAVHIGTTGNQHRPFAQIDFDDIRIEVVGIAIMLDLDFMRRAEDRITIEMERSI
jgi:hypothetical protein